MWPYLAWPYLLLSGRPKVSKGLLVTASGVSKGFGTLEALIGVHKSTYFTEILRKIVCMCKQCVPGRIFRPGNEASYTHIG